MSTLSRLSAARTYVANGHYGTARAYALMAFRKEMGIDPKEHSLHNFRWYSYCWDNGLGDYFKPLKKGK